MSNPPPSPVTDGNRENSSDFDTHEHVVNVTSPEKAYDKGANDFSTSNQQLERQSQFQLQQQQQNNSYEDDFLDMHCDDMDMF